MYGSTNHSFFCFGFWCLPTQYIQTMASSTTMTTVITTDTDATRPRPVYLCYDDRMLKHRPLGWTEPDSYPTQPLECPLNYPFENPARIQRVYDHLLLVQAQLLENQQQENSDTRIFIPLECRPAPLETLRLTHSVRHLDFLAQTAAMNEMALDEARHGDADLYFCNDTYQAALLACGGLLAAVDAVCSVVPAPTIHTRALAVVRPPGHHACQSHAMGFCFVNSVAVAAKHAVHTGLASRVLIVDWDIHHGNGTQELTIDNPSIVYASLHRYAGSGSRRGFFPYTGRPEETGPAGTAAAGCNCNVAWTAGAMGNVEYAAALAELVWPIAAHWEPDLVLVSCGLDAAAGDLIGDGTLTPDFFHAMTASLMQAVGTTVPIVVAMEGGYTLHVLEDCMEAVALALMDQDYSGSLVVKHACKEQQEPVTESSLAVPRQSLPPLSKAASDNGIEERLRQARRTLEPYWNESTRQQIDATAKQCINKSIRAMQKTERWQDIGLATLAPVAVRQSSRTKPPAETKTSPKTAATSISSTITMPSSPSIIERAPYQVQDAEAALNEALQALHINV